MPSSGNAGCAASPNTTLDSDIYLFDAAKGETRHITPHQGNVKYDTQTFDPASQRLLFLANDGGEFTSVRTYDLATGAMRESQCRAAAAVAPPMARPA